MNYSHGSLENHIMNVVWAIEEEAQKKDICVNDVLEQMNGNGSTRAYTTVKTVMDRLVNKEVLVRYKVGKKFCYKSTSSRAQMAKSAIKKLASQYFRNDLASLAKAVQTECSNSTH